jgi:hypothetical protein
MSSWLPDAPVGEESAQGVISIAVWQPASTCRLVAGAYSSKCLMPGTSNLFGAVFQAVISVPDVATTNVGGAAEFRW